MSEEIYSAEENLAFIRNMMEKARRRTTQSGSFLAVWGSLSSITTFIQYLAVMGHVSLKMMPYVWGVFLLLGVTYSVLKGRSLEKSKGQLCGNEMITSNLFIGIGISLGVFFFSHILGAMMGMITNVVTEICYVVSIVMAIAFYGASYSTGIKWFRLVAFGWWAAVALFVIKPFADQNLLLIIAVLDFLLLALPGFMLMAQVKKEQADS